MEDSKNLITVLTVLDSQWGRLTSDLTPDQLSYLKTEFLGLQDKIKSIEDIDELNELSKGFVQMFSDVDQLEFLANIGQPQMRGGEIAEIVEEIRMKIINYCVTLQDKIDISESEKQ